MSPNLFDYPQAPPLRRPKSRATFADLPIPAVGPGWNLHDGRTPRHRLEGLMRELMDRGLFGPALLSQCRRILGNDVSESDVAQIEQGILSEPGNRQCL
jgi:hypothetical protein